MDILKKYVLLIQENKYFNLEVVEYKLGTIYFIEAPTYC